MMMVKQRRVVVESLNINKSSGATSFFVLFGFWQGELRLAGETVTSNMS